MKSDSAEGEMNGEGLLLLMEIGKWWRPSTFWHTPNGKRDWLNGNIFDFFTNEHGNSIAYLDPLWWPTKYARAQILHTYF